MVDALREARRVLTAHGTLIDVRPPNLPIVVEVVKAGQSTWAREIEVCGTPEEIAAADAAVQHALSDGWFRFENSLRFEIEVYCDTAADLSVYAQARQMREAEIPYADLEARQRALSACGESAGLRCRRQWMLSAYRKLS